VICSAGETRGVSHRLNTATTLFIGTNFTVILKLRLFIGTEVGHCELYRIGDQLARCRANNDIRRHLPVLPKWCDSTEMELKRFLHVCQAYSWVLV